MAKAGRASTGAPAARKATPCKRKASEAPNDTNSTPRKRATPRKSLALSEVPARRTPRKTPSTKRTPAKRRGSKASLTLKADPAVVQATLSSYMPEVAAVKPIDAPTKVKPPRRSSRLLPLFLLAVVLAVVSAICWCSSSVGMAHKVVPVPALPTAADVKREVVAKIHKRMEKRLVFA